MTYGLVFSHHLRLHSGFYLAPFFFQNTSPATMEMPASPSHHQQSDLAAVPQETARPSENKEKLPGLFSESSQKNQHHSFKILLPLPLAFLSQLHLQHLVKII